VTSGSDGEGSQPLEVIDLASEVGTSAGPSRPASRRLCGWAVLVVVIVGSAAAWVAVVVASHGGGAHARRPHTDTVPVGPIVSIPGLVPIELPAMAEIPHARPLFTRRFSWGRGPASVGFVAGRHRVPDGPAAFTAGAKGNVVIFDAVNRRLVERRYGRAIVVTVHGTSALGMGPVVMDSRLRLITSDGSGGFFVVASNGAGITHYPPRDSPVSAAVNVQQLVIDGPNVFIVADNDMRIVVLHDNGAGYRPTPTAKWEPTPIRTEIREKENPTIGRSSQPGTGFALRAPWHLSGFLASKLRPDDTIATVVEADALGSSPPNRPVLYSHLLVTIDRHGHAKAEQFPVSSYYTDARATFEFHDDYFAVMSDTPRDGVTITGYPYPDNPAN
jgi:hypothetical protein